MKWISALIIGFLTLEILFRVQTGTLLSTTNFIVEATDLIKNNSGVLMYDETVGWKLADNYGSGKGFSTGQYGVRYNGFPTTLNNLTGGILVVGDSFTAGSGVDNDETWPAQLEQLIGKPVYNASSGGWAVDQMVLRAETLLPIFKPSLLIVSILADDTLRNNFSIYGGGYKPYFDSGLNLKNVPVPMMTGNRNELGAFKQLAGYSKAAYMIARDLGFEDRWVTHGIRYNQVNPDKFGINVSCYLMARITKFNVKTIVVMMYGGVATKGERPWYGPPVTDCAQKEGLKVVDMYPTLNKIAQTDLNLYKTLWLDENGQVGHPTAANNRIVAKTVFEAMR